jgi:DNA-binding MurR/RpiR family transcriptional regulator
MTGQPSDVTPVLSRLRTMRERVPDALVRVVDQVLADPTGITRLPLVELAERSGVSPATVTRFCRTVGFDDYAGLRVAIAAESGQAAQARWEVDLGRDIEPDDPIDRVLEVIAHADSRTIQETAAQLDMPQVDKVAAAIAEGRRLDMFGVGASALSAAELAFRLDRIGIACWARSEVHTALTSAALLGPGDVALAISHGGRTREAVEVLTEARKHHAMTVAMTSFPKSPLADAADVVLTTSVRETTFRPEALAAKHAQLLVLDLVYVRVAQRRYEQTSRAYEITASAVEHHRTTRRLEPRPDPRTDSSRRERP